MIGFHSALISTQFRVGCSLKQGNDFVMAGTNIKEKGGEGGVGFGHSREGGVVFIATKN